MLVVCLIVRQKFRNIRNNSVPENDKVEIILVDQVVHDASVTGANEVVHHDTGVVRLRRHDSRLNGTTERLAARDGSKARVQDQVGRHVLYVTTVTAVCVVVARCRIVVCLVSLQ